MSKQTVYTFGYTGRQPQELAAIAASLDALVIDVRYSPFSRNHIWNKKQLVALLGDRYRHVKALGNENYKGGPIKLLDPQAGVREVSALLDTQPVILTCVCQNVNWCHRKVAAELLAEELGVEVIHLPPDYTADSGMQTALFG